MDSRTALRGSVVSKRLVSLGLVAAAAVLGMAGAFALHAVLSIPTAPAHRTVQFVNGSAWDDANRLHGTQFIGGADVSPAAPRDPSDQRGGPKD